MREKERKAKGKLERPKRQKGRLKEIEKEKKN